MTACSIPIFYTKEHAKNIVQQRWRVWMLVPESIGMCENLQNFIFHLHGKHYETLISRSHMCQWPHKVSMSIKVIFLLALLSMSNKHPTSVCHKCTNGDIHHHQNQFLILWKPIKHSLHSCRISPALQKWFFATYLLFVGGTNVEIVNNSGNPRL